MFQVLAVGVFLFKKTPERRKKSVYLFTKKESKLQADRVSVLQIEDLCVKILSWFSSHLTKKQPSCELGKKGLEPLTLRLSGVYSNLLSYMPHPHPSMQSIETTPVRAVHLAIQNASPAKYKAGQNAAAWRLPLGFAVLCICFGNPSQTRFFL